MDGGTPFVAFGSGSSVLKFTGVSEATVAWIRQYMDKEMCKGRHTLEEELAQRHL